MSVVLRNCEEGQCGGVRVLLCPLENTVLCPVCQEPEQKEPKHAEIVNDIRHPVQINTCFLGTFYLQGTILTVNKRAFKFYQGIILSRPFLLQRREMRLSNTKGGGVTCPWQSCLASHAQISGAKSRFWDGGTGVLTLQAPGV